MVTVKWICRCSSAASCSFPPLHGLGAGVYGYFARHPGISREGFLLDAVGTEIDFFEQAGAGSGPSHSGEGQPTTFAGPPRPTEEDIRLHAWLNKRLATLHRE